MSPTVWHAFGWDAGWDLTKMQEIVPGDLVYSVPRCKHSEIESVVRLRGVITRQGEFSTTRIQRGFAAEPPMIRITRTGAFAR